jgi:uncharacterized SAM-binding protein YcdF (DUF218 family)
MGFLLSKLLPLVLYPLGLALLLQLTGLLGRRRRWGPWLGWLGLAVLWLASMPLVSRQLVWNLEEQASHLTPSPLPKADAVLVLGGGIRPALAPRRDVEVSEAGDRLLTGIALLRRGQAPFLLVSGGRIDFTSGDPSPPEAQSSARLARELGMPPQRILMLQGPGPDGPRNTAEEAIALGRLARGRGWHSLLLVTSATHLPRALATFRRSLPTGSGLTLIPVACDFLLPERRLFGRPTAASLLKSLLPSSEELDHTTVVLKEQLGLLIYRLRGWAQ